MLESASNIIESWLFSEQNNIIQGQLLPTLTKAERLIQKSKQIQGFSLVDVNGRTQSLIFLMTVGTAFPVASTDLPINGIADKKINRKGLFSYSLAYPVVGQQSVYIIFRTKVDFWLPLLLLVVLWVIFSLGFSIVWSKFLEREKFELFKDALYSLDSNQPNLKYLRNEAGTFLKLWEATQDRLRAAKQLEAMHAAEAEARMITRQVSHDIRSPLAALNMLVSSIRDLPDDRRQILRQSVNRINDIANSLLSRARGEVSAEGKNCAGTTKSVELLPTIVDSMVSEKRIQFRDKINLDITADMCGAYDCFIEVNPIELKRALSNLINNSAEALNDFNGRIIISVRKQGDQVSLIVSDNGRGMPPHVLQRLGSQGFTYGKQSSESGNGLGIYHAKKTVEAGGGQFTVESKVNLGTKIELVFRKERPPDWFVREVNLSDNSIIITIDDDLSIHSLWGERFKLLGLNARKLIHLTFSSPIEFREWMAGPAKEEFKSKKKTFLVDYEFANHAESGIEIINKLGINGQAYLVTSRFDEVNLQSQATSNSISIIPKAMIAEVPIVCPSQVKQHYDAILIDDDEIIRMTWELAAKQNQKKILALSNGDDFFKHAPTVFEKTPLFFDSQLADGIKGQDLARTAFEIGFSEIYLCTGFEHTEFPAMPWIKKIIGKTPIF